MVHPSHVKATDGTRYTVIMDTMSETVTQSTLFERSESATFRITGQVAWTRIRPLLKLSNEQAYFPVDGDETPDFLWENTPRHETKSVRDSVKCYSHLPNGTNILDSKYVLGRLLGSLHTSCSPYLAVLESHCFRGKTGFLAFAEKVDLCGEFNRPHENATPLPDLMNAAGTELFLKNTNSTQPNMWVVKDSYSNGAGGVWVVGPTNASQRFEQVLTEEHTYVAQRYAWPLVLFEGRKCHVRVYALLTADGRAHVHNRCFLHVANEEFESRDDTTAYKDAVHITNCCANSHDPNKFAGEICADLEQVTRKTDQTIGLADFAHSIRASVATLAKEAFPYLQGGQTNNGFEYLGLDFILSYRDGEPVAYLLEVNAPPSQDTATGLPHAEHLHDNVILDLLSLWVYPCVSGVNPIHGGWVTVHQDESRTLETVSVDTIPPSKAAILNKIRWTLFERKVLSAAKKSEMLGNQEVTSSKKLAHFARNFFPFFNEMSSLPKTSSGDLTVFFENAGGTQVPSLVVDAMCVSLRLRHRSVVGSKSAAAAKQTLGTILGASPSLYSIFLGANASSLLATLAQRYVLSGFLQAGDEIVLRTDNHLANTQPWIDAATSTGAIVKWWSDSSTCDTNSATEHLKALLSTRTRLVAVPHASNILGTIVDVKGIRSIVNLLTDRNCHIVVDGVAAVPHHYASVDDLGADWYSMSCHKCFGPHIGAICGKTSIVEEMTKNGNIQIGTVNYEACEGICGMGRYLATLSTFDKDCVSANGEESNNGSDDMQQKRCIVTQSQVEVAYSLIAETEEFLTRKLLSFLKRSSNVRVIESYASRTRIMRLPVVCFVHKSISSTSIVAACDAGGVAIRNGTFLSTHQFQSEFHIDPIDGVVRFSLAHYNNVSEIERAFRLLQAIPGWY